MALPPRAKHRRWSGSRQQAVATQLEPLDDVHKHLMALEIYSVEAAGRFIWYLRRPCHLERQVLCKLHEYAWPDEKRVLRKEPILIEGTTKILSAIAVAIAAESSKGCSTSDCP